MPIKTFVEACKALKLDPKKVLPDVSGMPAKMKKPQLAYAKLVIIAEALNDGWVPNWDDEDEYKYWPWFWMNSPGFRFDGSRCGLTGSHSAGGSRLCFRTREISDYAAKTFLALWKDMMVIPGKPKKKKK